MLNVYITTDVEIWCGGWNDLDLKFPEAFRHYIYGTTTRGDYGIPIQLKILQDHNLLGVFFVEPLFATRFGEQPLSEIIELINAAKQEVQLHLHTEWVDESYTPIIENSEKKRQFLSYYSLDEQRKLIAKGKQLLIDNGCPQIKAFRAGGFGANFDTLDALNENDIYIDSSYNHTLPACKLVENKPIYHRKSIGNTIEFPMSCFSDYPGHFRHAQIGACSSKELHSMLYQAVEKKWDSFVILFHSFELLTPSKSEVDDTVYKRFLNLCKFLDLNRDLFNTTGFNTLEFSQLVNQPSHLTSNIFNTTHRLFEQLRRKM